MQRDECRDALPSHPDNDVSPLITKLKPRCSILKVVLIVIVVLSITCGVVYSAAPLFKAMTRSSSSTYGLVSKNRTSSQYSAPCCRLSVTSDKEDYRQSPATNRAPNKGQVCEKQLAQRLPQAIIIGARKGGTRAMLAFLRLHSAIQPSADEIHFFDKEENYIQGLDMYRECMPYSTCDQITIEKTPAYFTEAKVPERVHKMNSSIKLILVLRDPTERAISDYVQIREKKLRRGKSTSAFEELAFNSRTGKIRVSYNAIQFSLYHIYLTRWFQYFPRDQILVMCSEDLVANPTTELQKVERFLHLRNEISEKNFYFNQSKGFYCVRNRRGSGCLSKSKGRPHPYVRDALIQKLRDFFRPHNRILYKMIGFDCGWP